MHPTIIIVAILPTGLLPDVDNLVYCKQFKHDCINIKQPAISLQRLDSVLLATSPLASLTPKSFSSSLKSSSRQLKVTQRGWKDWFWP